MPECARCGAFTDNPAKKRYHYCQDCQHHFDRIRQNGIVVRSGARRRDNTVVVNDGRHSDRGGQEPTFIEALARGKKLANELALDAMYEYEKRGSQWDLDAYLNRHPRTRSKVFSRLSRDPTKSSAGLITRLRRMLFR